MNLAGSSLKRPVTTVMVFVCLTVLGAVSFTRLPLAFLPEVDFPAIWVSVPYPNSNPATVERQITRPLEEALATMSGVDSLSSQSSADSADLSLRFKWGQDIDLIRLEVSERLDRIRGELPEDVRDIFIYKFSTSDIPVLQARVSAPGKDLSRSYELLEAKIKNRLERVPGVAKVELDGVLPKRLYVNLSLDRIREHSVDVGKLMARLRNMSVATSIGQVTAGGLRFNVRSVSDVDSMEALARIPVDGSTLRLGDVATLEYREPVHSYGRHLDGDFAVAVEVYKESTANTVEVARAAQRVITDEIGQDPELEGIRLFVFQDMAEEIENGIHGLRSAGAVGASLALVVLFLFLRRLGPTLVVCLAMPVSIILSFSVLYGLGKSLNVLSMMGLMLGVGMLVDNSIVVLESIYRRRQAGEEAGPAAIHGSRDVALAVLSSTVTSIIVFLPLVVGGENELSVWLGEVGVTIAITLVASLVVSLALTPLLAGRFLRGGTARSSRLERWVEARYLESLAFTLRHPVWTFVLATGALASAALPFSLGLEAASFAGGKNTLLSIEYDFHDHFRLKDVERVVDKVEAALEPRREKLHIKSIYSWYMEDHAATRLRFEHDLSDPEALQVRKALREGFPRVPGVKFMLDSDEDSGRILKLGLMLYGDSSAELKALGDRAVRSLQGVPGLEDVRIDARATREEVAVHVDRERARANDLTPAAVSQIFGFSLGGVRLRPLRTREREVELQVGLRTEDVSRLEDLKRLQVGRGVRLGDLARFDLVRSAGELRREARKSSVRVVATYEGEEFGKARQEIARRMDNLGLPPGYSWSFGRRLEESDAQGRQMAENFLLALALVYIVMASLFESLLTPFAILSTVLFAVVGVPWFLLVTGTPFNIMAQIGLLILIGVAVNNGIVMLDRVKALRDAGVERREALYEAGRSRLRPILMTALTTILGLAPLALGRQGVGGAYYYPLARTVIGGLAASTVMTLLLLPYVYERIDAVGTWLRRVYERASAPRRRRLNGELPAP